MSNRDKGAPRVGVALLVVRGDAILMAKRKGGRGAGEYGLPGGHLEAGETFESCALRELKEECGPVIVTMPRFLCLSNLRTEDRHYVGVGLVAHWLGGEAQTMEPDKFEDWQWYQPHRLPFPRFGVTDDLVIAYQTTRSYFPLS